MSATTAVSVISKVISDGSAPLRASARSTTSTNDGRPMVCADTFTATGRPVAATFVACSKTHSSTAVTVPWRSAAARNPEGPTTPIARDLMRSSILQDRLARPQVDDRLRIHEQPAFIERLLHLEGHAEAPQLLANPGLARTPLGDVREYGHGTQSPSLFVVDGVGIRAHQHVAVGRRDEQVDVPHDLAPQGTRQRQ